MRIVNVILVSSSVLYWSACSGKSADGSGADKIQPSGGQPALASGGATGGGQSSDGSGGAAAGGGGSSSGGSGGEAPSTGGMGGAGSGGTDPEGTGGMGSGGSGGTATGGAGGDEDIEVLADGSPLLFSNTGLYADDMVTLAEGVRPFEPQFVLWTDGAKKKRWIWLPEGEKIDTSTMDYWQFPTGTRLFKEFVRDDVRVETRMMTKRERGGWQRVAYLWREDQSEADAVVDAVLDAGGTDHDIPSQEDCGTCHFQTTDKILGFSAIQLAWDNSDADAWTLSRLTDAGLLSDAPPAIQVPGDDSAQAALGYLHANCGHCHNPLSSVTTRVTLSFWLTTEGLGSVEETATYASTVCKDIELQEGGVPGITTIIDPGSPDTSSVFQRVNRRGDDFAMPPLGTEMIDPVGRDAVEAWITSLSAVTCP